jgi:hypothetical protein
MPMSPRSATGPPDGRLSSSFHPVPSSLESLIQLTTIWPGPVGLQARHLDGNLVRFRPKVSTIHSRHDPVEKIIEGALVNHDELILPLVSWLSERKICLQIYPICSRVFLEEHYQLCFC